jgi:hypothetical protein
MDLFLARRRILMASKGWLEEIANFNGPHNQEYVLQAGRYIIDIAGSGGGGAGYFQQETPVYSAGGRLEYSFELATTDTVKCFCGGHSYSGVGLGGEGAAAGGQNGGGTGSGTRFGGAGGVGTGYRDSVSQPPENGQAGGGGGGGGYGSGGIGGPAHTYSAGYTSTGGVGGYGSVVHCVNSNQIFIAGGGGGAGGYYSGTPPGPILRPQTPGLSGTNNKNSIIGGGGIGPDNINGWIKIWRVHGYIAS